MISTEIKIQQTTSIVGSVGSIAAGLFNKSINKIISIADEYFSDRPLSHELAELSALRLKEFKTEMSKQRDALKFLLSQNAKIQGKLFPEIEKSLQSIEGKLDRKEDLLPIMAIAYSLGKQKIDHFITSLSIKTHLNQNDIKALKNNKLIKLVVFNIFLKEIFKKMFNFELSQDELLSLYGNTETSKLASLIEGKDFTKIEEAFKISNYSIIFEINRLFEGTFLQKGKENEFQASLDYFISE